MKEYQDFYFRKARAENYPARSVYKLKEIDAKFRLLKSGMKALDLGAAPGSWSLALAEKIGKNGVVVACDLKDTDTAFPPCVHFVQSDIYDPCPEYIALLKEYAPFDIAVSDMAPSTTGSTFTDQARSYSLSLAAYETACQYLAAGGHFVTKIFMGPDVQQLQAQMRQSFKTVKTFKPRSSRSESKETFLVGLGFLNK